MKVYPWKVIRHLSHTSHEVVALLVLVAILVVVAGPWLAILETGDDVPKMVKTQVEVTDNYGNRCLLPFGKLT